MKNFFCQIVIIGLIVAAFCSGAGIALWKNSDNIHPLILGSIALIVPVFLCLPAVLLFRRLNLEMNEFMKAVRLLGQGQLYVRIGDRPSTGVLQKFATHLTEMGSSLNDKLTGFFQSANQVCFSALTLEDCAAGTAENAARQAEKTHQIAAASEQMAQTIRQIASHAEAVSGMSSEAMKKALTEKERAERAEQSSQQVTASTDLLAQSMSSLESSIAEIGNVVTVIRSIADQTNLLALNASIEAARAGSHGRGFAVVASEVKLLAENTISATSDIAAKITQIQEDSRRTATSMVNTCQEVKGTGRDISQLGQALNGMFSAFGQVHQQISEISGMVREQSAATGEVTNSIEQMAQISGEMEGMARQVQQEVKSLHTVTDELLLLLDRFRLQAHEKARCVVAEVAGLPELISMDRGRQEDLLRRTVSRHSFLELLYVTDLQGRQTTSNIFADDGIATSYGSDGFNMDWSQRPWFIGTMKAGSCFISDLYRSAATDRFCFTVAYPIRDDQQQIKGVLGADINVIGLLERLQAG